MSKDSDNIIAFKVSQEEYKKLEELAKMFHEAGRLPKPTVNSLAKVSTFVVYNQSVALNNQAGAVNGQ